MDFFSQINNFQEENNKRKEEEKKEKDEELKKMYNEINKQNEIQGKKDRIKNKYNEAIPDYMPLYAIFNSYYYIIDIKFIKNLYTKYKINENINSGLKLLIKGIAYKIKNENFINILDKDITPFSLKIGTLNNKKI